MTPTKRAQSARARPDVGGREDPVRQFFSIGDVCTLTELKPHVLRYWETQFKFLSPAKNRSGNRVYQRREVELILLVKHLLYAEKYTIEGARRKVDEHRKGGAIRTISRAALERETLESMERELAAMVRALRVGGSEADDTDETVQEGAERDGRFGAGLDADAESG
jgi:DNA-binding transcriptional MerR regulator